ncbi:MAG: FlgD immunoglobulin-like domain containing protein [Candidatus Krumholzibacteriia bacterium]
MRIAHRNSPQRVRRTIGALCLMVAAAAVVQAVEPVEAWVHIWDGPAGQGEGADRVAFDEGGGILVAGTTVDNSAGGHLFDYFVQRLDADGNELWTVQYGDTGGEVLFDLIARPEGAVVSGLSFLDTTVTLTTVAYDLAGQLVWVADFPVVYGAGSTAGAILARDAAGNVYAGATSADQMLVVAYDAAGNLIRESTHGRAGRILQLLDLVVDDGGRAFAVGVVSGGAAGPTELVTVGFAADGQVMWEHPETGDVGSVFPQAGIAMAPSGAVGDGRHPETIFADRVRSAHLAAGRHRRTGWRRDLERRSFGAGSSSSTSRSAPTDSRSSAATAASLPPGSQHRPVRRRRSTSLAGARDRRAGRGDSRRPGRWTLWATPSCQAGSRHRRLRRPHRRVPRQASWCWSRLWTGPGASSQGVAVAVSAAGEVVMGGATWTSTSPTDALAVLYRQPTPTGAEPTATGRQPDVRALLNPFSGTTTVRYTPGRAGATRLSVFDLRGRRVRTLQAGFASEGDHQVTWRGEDDQGRSLPSGTYLPS